MEKPDLVRLERSASLIRPADSHKPAAKALQTLDGQTDAQADQISEQLQILLERAKRLTERRRISKIVYSCEFGFQPIVQQSYYMYRAPDRLFVSMIGPNEWSVKRKRALVYIAQVKLDYDHTWEILDLAEDIFSEHSQ